MSNTRTAKRATIDSTGLAALYVRVRLRHGERGPRRGLQRKFLEWHIDHFVPEEAEIDHLFISHLDDDHFNGCRQLVQKKKVLRIVLPYLQIDDLLLLIADGKITTNANIAEIAGLMGGGGTAFDNVPVTSIVPAGFDGPQPNVEQRADNEFRGGELSTSCSSSRMACRRASARSPPTRSGSRSGAPSMANAMRRSLRWSWKC